MRHLPRWALPLLPAALLLWLLIHSTSGAASPLLTMTPSHTPSTTATATGTLTVTVTGTLTTTITPSPSPTFSGTMLPAYLPYLTKPMPSPTPTATPTPSATPTATPTSDAPEWLRYLNRFRDAAALPPLTENPTWSHGDWLHSRYMVKEDHISHDEKQDSPWYTAEGALAGRNGNIFATSWTSASDETAIDFWMAGPFHAVAILDPEMQQTAFGAYREDNAAWYMGATLEWNRGRGPLPDGITFPITFPRDGGQTWITRHPGHEWPDPLTACPGYEAPTGPPLIIQLGSGNLTPQVTAHSFGVLDGGDLPHCVFDETTYTNPSPSAQNSGRQVLNSRDAVVIMPRYALTPSQSYRASITANGVTYNWQFTVSIPSHESHFIPDMERAIMR